MVLFLGANLTLAEDKTSPVIISEVCFYPKQGKAQWLELANISERVVDISGWKIRNERFSLVLPKGLNLAPSRCLLIVFDGKNELEHKQGSYILHSFDGINTRVLGSADSGQCALYDAKGKMMAFVLWGTHPFDSNLVKDAVKAGLWQGLYYFVPVKHSRSGIKGPIKEIKEGGTIGLYNYPNLDPADAKQWVVYDPDEVTEGMLNPLVRPVLHLPPNGAHITQIYDMNGHLTSTISFSCAKVPGADKYRFQLCRNKDCREVLKDEIENYIVWNVEFEQRGIYYWRAMAIDTRTGRKSKWSRVNEFRYGYDLR